MIIWLVAFALCIGIGIILSKIQEIKNWYWELFSEKRGLAK